MTKLPRVHRRDCDTRVLMSQPDERKSLHAFRRTVNTRRYLCQKVAEGVKAAAEGVRAGEAKEGAEEKSVAAVNLGAEEARRADRAGYRARNPASHRVAAETTCSSRSLPKRAASAPR